MKIYPYINGSKSAKALAMSLNIKRLFREGKPIKVKDVVINWGCSRIRRDVKCPIILNPPDCVAIAGNKLSTFKALTGIVGIPEWTESLVEASTWLDEGFDVVARTTLTGHSGEGIIISTPGDDLPVAPLYVKYIPKKDEYRIHVFQGKAFFVQRKARNKEIPNEKVDWKVRNHGNGFIFAHKDVDVPDVAKEYAIMAVKTLGLDFGAVDIIKHAKKKEWFILEINTACGLEGTTLTKYTEQFEGILK
jgi:glutathione synthase/RimK-type ligase-like ATP-grasp enzyme